MNVLAATAMGLAVVSTLLRTCIYKLSFFGFCCRVLLECDGSTLQVRGDRVPVWRRQPAGRARNVHDPRVCLAIPLTP